MCRTASPQNLPGTFMLLRRDLAITITVLFLRSTMPFCCGVYGTVRCYLIPASSHNRVNSAERNSPSRSVLNILMRYPLVFLACNLNFLNMEQA